MATYLTQEERSVHMSFGWGRSLAGKTATGSKCRDSRGFESSMCHNSLKWLNRVFLCGLRKDPVGRWHHQGSQTL